MQDTVCTSCLYQQAGWKSSNTELSAGMHLLGTGLSARLTSTFLFLCQTVCVFVCARDWKVGHNLSSAELACVQQKAFITLSVSVKQLLHMRKYIILFANVTVTQS